MWGVHISGVGFSVFLSFSPGPWSRGGGSRSAVVALVTVFHQKLLNGLLP